MVVAAGTQPLEKVLSICIIQYNIAPSVKKHAGPPQAAQRGYRNVQAGSDGLIADILPHLPQVPYRQ